jgi:hypothetical protein
LILRRKLKFEDCSSRIIFQAVLTLVGLVLSRGNASDVLQAIDVLLNIHKVMGKKPMALKLGTYLNQISSYQKNANLPVLLERSSIGKSGIFQKIIFRFFSYQIYHP